MRGALAGAAGTTALDAVTYADMAIRGRSASSAPADVVTALAKQLGHEVPGLGERRDHRTEGLGALAGYAVGVTVGTAAGVVHRFLRRHGKSVPAPVAAVLIGGAAMALSDLPLALLGISDPRDWTAKDWVADALPHVVFGFVTQAALQAQS